MRAFVYACVRAYLRACVCACVVCVCMHPCVRAGVRACGRGVRVCVSACERVRNRLFIQVDNGTDFLRGRTNPPYYTPLSGRIPKPKLLPPPLSKPPGIRPPRGTPTARPLDCSPLWSPPGSRSSASFIAALAVSPLLPPSSLPSFSISPLFCHRRRLPASRSPYHHCRHRRHCCLHRSRPPAPALLRRRICCCRFCHPCRLTRRRLFPRPSLLQQPQQLRPSPFERPPS